MAEHTVVGFNEEQMKILQSYRRTEKELRDKIFKLHAEINQLTTRAERAERYACSLHVELQQAKARLGEAEKVLGEYANGDNWSTEVTYEEEDYRSVNSNGCPESYEVTIEAGYMCWGVGFGDAGYELAEKYFEKFYPQEDAK